MEEVIRRRHSNATAAILKVMGLFSGVQVVTILCSMVRTKLVALWIGAEGVGLFGIFNSAIDMLGALTTLGIATSAVRTLAAAGDEEKPQIGRVVLRWGLILGLFGALVIVLGAPLLSQSSFGNGHWTAAFALLAICMIFNASTGTNRAVMQGFGRYKALARSTVAGAVAGIVVSVPLFYFLGVDSIVPATIGFSAVAYFATRYYRPKLADSTPLSRPLLWQKGKEFLRLGAYMTVTSTAAYLVSYIFLSWLNRRADVDTVGYYQAGLTLFNRYAGLIFTAIAVEYYPRLSSVATKRRSMAVMVNHEATLLLWMLLAIVPVFILCVPLMIRVLYAEPFMVMAPFVTLGIVGTVLRGLSWCMSFTILAKGDGKLFLFTELLSSAVCLALNIAGYGWGGLAGLGVSYILWYAVYTLIVAVVYYRFYRMRIDRRVWGHTAIVLLVSMLAAMVALSTPWWWLNIPLVLPAAGLAALKLRRLYRR